MQTQPDRPAFHIDLPKPARIVHPIEHVWGWVAADPRPDRLSASIGGVAVPCGTIARAAAGRVGFSIYLDLSRLPDLLVGRPEVLRIDLDLGRGPGVALPLTVDPQAYDLATGVRDNRAQKAAFLARHSRGASHRPGLRAPAHLPRDWTLSPRLEDKADGVSSHLYAAPLLDFLTSFGPDQFILDAGAGLRKRPQRNVINLEIFDYPSTDIIATGQSLPFDDNCFDAAVSIAVLEHVDDPAACAAEILRVLKPGGVVFASVPFLQPEHGYPSHYFNATRFGLRKLFEGADLVHHGVPDGVNHPIMTLNRVASLYAAGLPVDQRDGFLDLTLRELLATPPQDHFRMGTPFVTDLNEDTRWKLAFATSASFRKR